MEKTSLVLEVAANLDSFEENDFKVARDVIVLTKKGNVLFKKTRYFELQLSLIYELGNLI